jgi:hypothetical protein
VTKTATRLADVDVGTNEILQSCVTSQRQKMMHEGLLLIYPGILCTHYQVYILSVPEYRTRFIPYIYREREQIGAVIVGNNMSHSSQL